MKLFCRRAFSLLLVTVTVICAASSLTLNTAAAKQTLIPQFAAGTFTSSFDYSIKYRMYVPEDYTPERQYPFILFLHGWGQRSQGDVKQLEIGINTAVTESYDILKDCIILAPQCGGDTKWVNVPAWTNVNYSTETIAESDGLKTVYELLVKLKSEYSVDDDRVYVTGLSMGGFGTWDMIVRHTDMFAAAIPVCGGCDVSKAERLVDFPIYTFHGTADVTVPPTGTAAMEKAIQELGGNKMTYIRYEGMDHSIWTKAYGEEGLFEWLLAQNRSDRPEFADETTTLPEITTETPATTTAPETSAANATAEPKPENGCGSVSAVVYLWAVLGTGITAVVLRKKH